MQQKTKFEIQKDGKLKVTMVGENICTLPAEGKSITVGSVRQETVQVIDKNKITMLKASIKQDKDSTEGNIANLKLELEKLKHINEKLIPADIMKGCARELVKGSKAFRKQMSALNDFIARSQKKIKLIEQIEFVGKQLEGTLDSWNQIKSLVL